ncbi:MarR family winged helix-turn-helix transcriptional regulator [Amycolatopsis sp. NPDC051071]|uniref:MarR family winged helix-turn-helix transcriptional regulator n=1 Tax=Amycolatopsis sp. NPDC051071 TaxID=3154637 RepID=UPI00341CDCC5
MSELPVVNQPPHRCGALLDHVTRRIRLRSESVLAPLGLRPRHLVALTVLRDRRGCSQQDLAKTLEMDGTNVVGLLNDLESANLVERRRSPEDRRRHIVELTDVGIKQLVKAEFALAGVEDDVLGGLDPDQRETLYNLLYLASSRTEAVACVEAANVDDC